VEGDEVAQLYVRQETASVVTPVKSLKGFHRMHLKPGETQMVKFIVPQSELAIWNVENKWAVEPAISRLKWAFIRKWIGRKFTLK